MSGSSPKLRVGIVGASFGGAVHLPSFNAQGNFEVVAIASPHRAAGIAKERAIPHAFASCDEMLAGVELDVVSVASPPFDHRRSVLAALARGKHVLCEKPFGLNVAECEEMVDAAERAGTVCALAHEFRYAASRRAMRELIRNGHLGPLRDMEVSWILNRLRARSARANSWWFSRAMGGGVTGAIMSHVVDEANHLAGRVPQRVAGFERTANPERESDGERFTSDVADGAFALLDYGDGFVARLTADGTHVTDSTLLAVHGETRSAVASGSSIADQTMFAIDDDETAELELKESPHAKLAAAHGNLPMFVSLLDEFANAIAGKLADLPTFADGLATQRVLARIGYETPSVTPA